VNYFVVEIELELFIEEDFIQIEIAPEDILSEEWFETFTTEQE